MRKSKAAARIRAGQTIRVCSLGHFVPAYICMAARSGYDCIWLDMEHRAWDPREAQALMPLFHQYDIDCLLRAPTREKTGLYRYLEDGATGLMIPHVSTPELAHDLVQSTKFPPVGDRGLDNAGFDSDFHANPDSDVYAAWANQETFLVVQIETPLALSNVDAIAATPGVDALFIGPGDLGLRLRGEGDSDGSMLEAAFEQVAEACRKHGKVWGCPASGRELIQRREAQGARLLANGGDFGFLMRGLDQAILEFDEK